jgi:hypothetical protein
MTPLPGVELAKINVQTDTQNQLALAPNIRKIRA